MHYYYYYYYYYYYNEGSVIQVAAPPYRPNTISGFCRLLHCPSDTLKNIIQLMKFEVQPELVVQNSLKWNISLCLTIPPVAPNIFPVGQPGIIGNKEKILIFMHLSRANLPPGQVSVAHMHSHPIAAHGGASGNTQLA